jgi:hypothetical protein
MIRITITAAAFEAIAATLLLGRRHRVGAWRAAEAALGFRRRP